MKLRCRRHDKRVMVLPSGNTVHRQDGSKCESRTLDIGGNTVSPRQMIVIDLTRNPGC